MLEQRRKLWLNVAVGILGLAVGAGNLLRGSGDGAGLRHTVLGAVCILLAAGWLSFLLARSHGEKRRRG